MKRFLTYILASVFLILTATSCNDVVLSDGMPETGYLGISLGVDDEVITKALITPDRDMKFKIEVFDKNGVMVADTLDHRLWTEADPLELPVGTYKVKASYGEKDAFGFDAPYYEGEAEVKVTANKTVTAEIICKLANIKVTVEFDQEIKDNFKSYSVFIDGGEGKGISFSSDRGNLDAEGYIPANDNGDTSVKWQLVLVNTAGKSYVANDTYTGLKKQQHYILKIKLGDPADGDGFLAIKLIVDNTQEEKEFDIDLDFSEAEIPEFSTNDGFVLTNQNTVMVGDDAKKEITFSAPEGIKSLVLGVDSGVKTRASSMEWYELVSADAQTTNALNAKGIYFDSIEYGDIEARIEITEYISSLPTGDYNIDMSLYDIRGHASHCPMDFTVISDVEADMVSVVPWAKFVLAKGKYFSGSAPEGLTFMYKKSGASSWTSVEASRLTVNSAGKTFEAEITGLDPASSYLIKAVTATDTETREVEFRTESAGTLYNMSFDDWYKDGKVYYPFRNGANPNVWDTANKATSSFGDSGTVQETSHVVSGSAAKLVSQYIVIAFAAGNLYTGNFGKIDGLGAELYWGTPFTSRPLALKGHYDYAPKSINNVESPHTDKKGQMDKCQIQVFLADWSSQFTINTTNGQFVDINSSDIIAFGRLESNVNTNGYKEFVLPLEYRDLTRTPKYAVISCCASYLGDYFTGGEGSTLFVDEFSFVYDPSELTEAEKAKVNYR